jgi:hypothetical protein
MESAASGTARPHLRPGGAILACALLLVAFAALSTAAARTKCPTYDETLHAVGAHVHATLGDFRINPEDPALFGHWSALIHCKDALAIDTGLEWWDPMLRDVELNQWYFAWWTLYRTRGNDGEAFIQRARLMFVLLGVLLGALIAWWSWQLAGAAAAVVATAFFALDPNFLAHAPLVKNDVMLALAMLAMAFSVWRFGRRGTLASLAGIALATAAAVNVKFSGALFGPILLLLLLARALLPHPWTVLGRQLRTRAQRLLVVAGACLMVALTSYAAIWACYGFRFAPTSDPPGALLASDPLIFKAKVSRLRIEHPPPAQFTEQMIADQPPGELADAILWAGSKRLLPQAWLHGLLLTYASQLARNSFLLGETSVTGWWYYFPLAMWFKTPTATLLAIALVGAGALVWIGHRARARVAADPSSPSAWTITCLTVPVGVYLASAMTTSLNLGLRHVLPVYPFLFLALGASFPALARAWRPALGVVVALPLLGLEAILAYPHYIPYFNAFAGGTSGGIARLGDSNLDWGQDLKLLARWQREHRDKKLYLAYFGTADPAYYGVEAEHFPRPAGGWPFAESPRNLTGLSYLAVSATNLQKIYVTDEVARELYTRLETLEPIAVLGGTIHVYDLATP